MSEVPAVQGCTAIFGGCKPLKMKESENHVFRFPYSEKSRMDLIQSFPKEPLIKSEVPAAQGRAVLFNGCKPKENEARQKSHFCFAWLERSPGWTYAELP